MVQDIGLGLMTYEYEEIPGDMTRGEWTEELLTQICYLLGDVASLTEGKADMEFILSVVGSYLISKERGTLPEDVRPPSFLFDEIMFPQIDTMEITKEKIEDGDTILDAEDIGEISKPTTKEGD